MNDVIGHGRCAICGNVGEFARHEAPTRETHRCEACGGSLRYRHQAATIAAAYGLPDITFRDLLAAREFADVVIYEPGIVGPFRRMLEGRRHYFNSYYWPDVTPGDEHEGVRCEDLQRLTLEDRSVDLVITSDIFEHVRHPMAAFAEIFRVLRPGGRHVFTVPLSWPLTPTTRARVDTSGAEDVFILPPRYHGSPVDPRGSLVYTDFGMDLPERLRPLGFETVTHHGYREAVTFVSRRPV